MQYACMYIYVHAVHTYVGMALAYTYFIVSLRRGGNENFSLSFTCCMHSY